jgi:NADP-dependent 3-hydroxy acid dehydrogenase YdfG
MTKLQDRVVAVTGASRGLGRQMARDLVAAGAKVALLARASPDLTEAAAELSGSAAAFPVDIADAASVASALDAAAARFGRLDTLVNNAGLYQPIRVDRSPIEIIERHLTTNLLGAIWCVRAAIPHLRAAGFGDIVNVSSLAARTPRPLLSVYAATKGGLESFSTGLRNELRKDRIRVTVLRIGSVAGGTGGADVDPAIRAEFLEGIQATGGAWGAPVSQTSLSGLLVDILALPADVSVNLVDARPI